MSKPTSLEMIIQHSKNIPVFKNMEKGDICALINNSTTKTVNKDEYIVKESFMNTQMYFILYGSFDVRVKNKKVAELHEGDIFGVGSVLNHYNNDISITTIIARSHKSLLLSFTIHPVYIEPCIISARFYQNIAKYFAHKLSVEHQLFNNLYLA